MQVGYQYDDGGRIGAGFKGHAGDCVPRALTVLTGAPYRQVYDDLAEANKNVRARGGKGKRSARNGVHKNAYTKVFAAYGVEKVKLPKGKRPTISEAHARYGNCIVSTAKHLLAVRDGNVRDTWDSRWVQREMLLCDECSWQRDLGDDDVIGSGVGCCEDCGERTYDYGYALFQVKYERKAMSVWVLPSRYDWIYNGEERAELELSDTVIITTYPNEADGNYIWAAEKFDGENWDDFDYGYESTHTACIQKSERWADDNKEKWQ